MNKWYNISWNRVIEILETDIDKGLNNEQIHERYNIYGNNQIDIGYKNELRKNILKALKTPWFWCSIIVIILSLIARNYLETTVLVVMTMLNVSLKYIDEVKRRKQIKSLESLNYTDVRVVRDFQKVFIKSEELVVGDVVYIKEKGIIPADMRIIESDELKINEKNLNGDDFSVEKYETMIEGRISAIGEIKNIAFRGTYVEKGSGMGVVVSTGNNTEIGKILTMLNSDNIKKHSLATKIENYINKIVIYISILLLIGSSLILNKLQYQQSIKEVAHLYFLIYSFGISVVIIFFIKIIKNNLRQDDIDLRNISTLATISNTNIFFLDKIGSITKEDMIIRKIYTNHEMFNEEEVDISDFNINRIINIGLLCNNAIYNVGNDEGKGDLIEIALLRLGCKKEVYKSLLNSKEKRVFEIPYDGERRIATSLNRFERKYRANIKGALDEVLERCTHIMMDGIEKELTEEDIEQIKQCDYKLSEEGLITIGIAYRSFSYEPSEGENIESNLVFVGIVGAENPIIEQSMDLINMLKRQGIVPILITDDNKIAATAIGKKQGFVTSMDEVISGVELLSLNKEEIFAILSKVRVFSRITPEMKGKIISIFVEDGYKVASVGENLADLPSIATSHVGIVKGEKAANVVKRMSDIYIKEKYLKGFLNILGVAHESKKTIDNMKQQVIKILFIESIVFILSVLLFKESAIEVISLLVLNALIIPSFILWNMMTKRQVDVKNKFYVILEIIVQCSIILLAANYLRQYFSIGLINFALFVPINIINYLISYKKGFKEKNKMAIVFFSVTLTIYFITLMALVLLTKISNYMNLLWLILFLVFYIISEFFLVKGKE